MAGSPLHRPAWREQATCGGLGADDYVHERGRRSSGYDLKLGAGCAVRQECLNTELADASLMGLVLWHDGARAAGAAERTERHIVRTPSLVKGTKTNRHSNPSVEAHGEFECFSDRSRLHLSDGPADPDSDSGWPLHRPSEHVVDFKDRTARHGARFAFHRDETGHKPATPGLGGEDVPHLTTTAGGSLTA
jgi:hypothetical protein